MKAKARFFKGIEFIQVNELPEEQQILLKSSPNTPERIKILIDGKVLDNCILYKEYANWHHTIYLQSVAHTDKPILEQEVSPVPVTLNKA
jgi:hypothetical protein